MTRATRSAARLLIALAAFAACTEAEPLEPAGPTPEFALHVSVKPRNATVRQGASRQFVAAITDGPSGVSWSATGGTIDGSGLFTAPAVPGTYTVTATSLDDPLVARSVDVIVPEVSVTADTAEVTTKVGRTERLVARVRGTIDPSLEWSANAGTITPVTPIRVRYTAPDAPGTYEVTARSLADTSKVALITVHVLPPATVDVDGPECFLTLVATAVVQGGTVDEVRDDDLLDWGEGGVECGDLDAPVSSAEAAASAGAPGTSASAVAHGSQDVERRPRRVQGAVAVNAAGTGAVQGATEELPWLSASGSASASVTHRSSFDIEDFYATLVLDAELHSDCDADLNPGTAIASLRLSGPEGTILEETVSCPETRVVDWTVDLPPGHYDVVASVSALGAGGGFSTIGNDDPASSEAFSSAQLSYDYRVRL